MPYTINKTNGGYVTTIADGTLDNTTDLTLIGKNYPGYGEILNENFVKLMENFASSSAPSAAMPGQLWWDLGSKTLKVNTATNQWKIISGSTASSTEPANKTIGDLWFDTVAGQLKVFNGTDWTLIGPSYSTGTGTTGAIVDSIYDTVGTAHIVVKYVIGEDTIVAIISKDAAFQPQSTINGFSTISPGITMSSTVVGAGFYGTASNADKLDNLNSSQFLRADANASTTGTLAVANDSGLSVGVDADLRLSVSGSDVYLTNNTSNGDIIVRVNKAGSISQAFYVDGATGLMHTTTPVSGALATQVATVGYVSGISAGTGFLKADGSIPLSGTLLPSTNNTIDLGSSGTKFADIYATNFHGLATSAEYADLAERFEADAAYEPGTVVEIGGDKEITAVTEELSDRVFGVISTRPGFLLNGRAGNDDTHPAVALNGRVPVKVVGKVTRGDRLVSAGNGLARAAQVGEASTFNVIGRALETKSTDGVGTITAIVKVQ